MEAKLGFRPSRFWSSVLKGRNLVGKGARFVGGQWANIDIWKYPWLPRSSHLPLDSEMVIFSKVADLIVPSTRQWNVDLVLAGFSHEEASLILEIPISIGPAIDKWVWPPSSLGKFFAKSAYRLAFSLASSNLSPCDASSSFRFSDKFWGTIWSLKIPPKLKHFWWKVCNNALAAKKNLVPMSSCARDVVQRYSQ